MQVLQDFLDADLHKKLENLFFSDYNLLKENKIDFKSIQNKYLGRKGLLNTLYPLLSKLQAEKKSEFGKQINNFKKEILFNLNKYKPGYNQGEWHLHSFRKLRV